MSYSIHHEHLAVDQAMSLAAEVMGLHCPADLGSIVSEAEAHGYAIELRHGELTVTSQPLPDEERELPDDECEISFRWRVGASVASLRWKGPAIAIRDVITRRLKEQS
jgi:hypothetical protein